ncbi:hypothetical protein GCM10022377_09820 [Zhihengliuella alba]|uniref:Uncharacterized protein n=1 Tax=Zhihengliuella alba TaxID=547018 RepID=A0ABP7D069_9MICC
MWLAQARNPWRALQWAGVAGAAGSPRWAREAATHSDSITTARRLPYDSDPHYFSQQPADYTHDTRGLLPQILGRKRGKPE